MSKVITTTDLTKSDLQTLLGAMGAEIERMSQGNHYENGQECCDASLYNRLAAIIEVME